MRRAVAAGAALAVLAVLLVPAVQFLTKENPRRSGTNAIFPSEVVAVLGPGQGLCQEARVPAGTRALELPLRDAAPGDGLRLRVLDGDRELAAAEPSGVRAGAVRFELPRTLGRDAVGRVCLDQGPGASAAFLGSLARQGLTQGGKPTPGAISIAYYRPGTESLLSMAPVIARRVGLTRGAFGGSWRAVAVLLCFGAGLALAGWLLVAFARGRSPRRAALLVAAVALLNSVAWGLLTPTHQVPDEPYHLSYVQDLAVHGEPPMPDPGVADRPSAELILIGNAAAPGTINFNPVARPSWSTEADAALDAALARDPSTDNRDAVVNVRDYPPLYYAAMVPAYAAAHAAGGSTLDAITLMRILGSLLAGVTVLALLGFLRELFPEREVLAAGIALMCAYQPVFTWIQAGINPDALLIPLGAVLFWLIARAWRRGLTTGTAVALGLVFAATVLTKVSALGLAPGFAAALVVLAWRRREGRLVVAGALAAAVPLVLYGLLNTLVWDRTLIPGGVSAAAEGQAAPAGQATSGFASYLWQYLLPPVGSMTDFFKVGWLPKDFWTPLWVGKFGWFDYEFPAAVNTAAFVVFAVVAVIGVVVLVLRWRGEWPLLLVFAILAGGLFGAIARAGYPLRAAGHTIFEQARYLMPLLALYAFAFALVVSLLKRRAELAVVGVLVGVSALHLLGAFILTVRRYYL